MGFRFGCMDGQNTPSPRAYAEIMNEFAAGERYLNRVWSASIDGYIDVINEYLGRARRQFEQAQAKLTALGAGGPVSPA